MLKRKYWFVILALLVVAAGFRIFVVHRWPNDAPDDGRVYAQFARNVLEQHIYSHQTDAPHDPSLIRLPGYPLFLAAVYSLFGHTNNGAVRIVQALMDTATCGLIALLAYYWQPDEKRKRASAIAALALAAVCPFTLIYATTILTEVATNFLVMAICLAATFAWRTSGDEKSKQSFVWWVIAGLLGGAMVMFRPDSGLFVAAVGLTLAITGLLRFRKEFRGAIVKGVLFSLAFAVVLAPWTIRNWRVFDRFQPLAPSHGEMPGEFVPRGYYLWLRTWLDDSNYIAPFLWDLDTAPIDVDNLPESAFDSDTEKQRVTALIDMYNHPDSQSQTVMHPTTGSLTAPMTSPSPSPSNPPDKTANVNSNMQTPAHTDESDPENSVAEDSGTHGPVEMTPDIDAGFAQLARERITRHPFVFYVWLPLKRARTIWFDTHSQYWPFEGTLLPLSDLDYGTHQQFWLPLFAALTALYTILGLLGGFRLWVSGEFAARRWLLLTVLAVFLRLLLFSSLENPEPRYVVEFFPFLSILGGIAIGWILRGTSVPVQESR